MLSISASCSSRKCQRFFVYKSTKIDIKGISANLKRNGISVGEKTIGSILIDPKYVQASEELQRLDLYQKTLCEQLNLIKSDSLKTIRRHEYVSALIDMMKIAQKPDSILSNRVVKLETAEERRANAEQYISELKKTPPNVNLNLIILPDSVICYTVEILNDVPFKFRATLGRYDNRSLTSDHLILSDPELNPQKKRNWFFSTGRKVNDPQLSQEDIFKVKLHFRYYSIYIDEVNAPGLYKTVVKVYQINRKELTVVELKE